MGLASTAFMLLVLVAVPALFLSGARVPSYWTELGTVLLASFLTVLFVALGCVQTHRTWIHVLLVAIFGYVVGDLLGRLCVPELRVPLDEDLGELILVLIVGSVAARIGIWLRKKALSEVGAS
jgi:hypothetical protein